MKHLSTLIITLLCGYVAVHAGSTQLSTELTVLLTAKDNDTVSFNYLKENNESRFRQVILDETIIPRFDGYAYLPEEKNTPFYAVFKKEGDVFRSTVYEAATGHITEISRYTKSLNKIVLEGMQEFYEGGKRFYQEEYLSGALLHTGYVDEKGNWLIKYSFEPITSRSDFQNQRAVAFQHKGNIAKLVQKEEYYSTQALKSKTTYRCNSNGKVTTKSEYYGINGKKTVHKPSNATKVVQDYINTHFEYAPINSEGQAVSVMNLLIPILIRVDSTGIVQSISLNGNITYEYQMITGYTTYQVDQRTGNRKELSSYTYSNNADVKDHIRTYGKHIIDSMYVFMQHLDAHLVCIPEMIDKKPQESTIITTIQRNCLKRYHAKKK